MPALWTAERFSAGTEGRCLGTFQYEDDEGPSACGLPAGGLPRAALCYSSGAAPTCQGSDSLEDLKNMEARGRGEIPTCGTCLDEVKR